MKAIGDTNKTASRSEHWRELIQQQVASGQTIHTFCSDRRLTEQSFYYWRKRLIKETPVTFALVATHESNGKSVEPTALELDLGSGRCLRIPRGVEVVTLRTVLSVLQERA